MTARVEPTWAWRGVAARPVVVWSIVALPLVVALGLLTDLHGIGLVSLGAGYAVGLVMLVRRWLSVAGVLLTYLTVLLALSAVAGRSGPLAVAVPLTLVVEVAVLGLTGRWLGLRRVEGPGDVGRVGLLAVVGGALTVLALWVNARVVDAVAFDTATARLTCLSLGIGLLVCVPLALGAAAGPPDVRGWRRRAELAVLCGVILVVLLGMALPPVEVFGRLGLLFVLVLAVGWLALRFGTFATAVALLVVSVALSYMVVHFVGPFLPGSVSLAEAIAGMQAYLVVTAFGCLLMAAFAEQARERQQTAVETAELLTSAVEGSEAELFVKRYDPASDRFVYVEANTTLARELGIPVGDIVGRSDDELMDADAAAHFRAEDDEVLRSGERRQFMSSVVFRGRLVHYLAIKFPVRDSDGTVVGVGGVNLDRTEQHRREQLLGVVFARSPVPTARLRWTGTGVGEVLEVNDAFATLLGDTPTSLVGKALDRFLADPTRVGGSTAGFALSGVRRELRLRRADGSELLVLATSTVVSPGGELDAFVLVILEDVTAQRAAEAGLVHRATHDGLTDLLNRQALARGLAAMCVRAGEGGRKVAVLCCDLDGFKHFNDSLGHDTGDRVLLAMAERVRAIVRPEDAVGRLGGDEYVVVCEVEDEQAAVSVGERLRAAVAEPLDVDGRVYALTAGIGVVVDDGRGEPEDLLRRADVALSHAKQTGRDQLQVYRPDVDQRIRVRMAMRETLRLALSENRVEAFMQPVIDLGTGRVRGAEALVRLRDLDGSLLSPAAFVAVAEESGLILPLGLRVLDLALATSARWAAAGHDLTVAVNVSPHQLVESHLAVTVSTLLETHGVPPSALVLEVTESAVVDATGPTLAVLRRLREQGVHVAIDDFGTGYSSLSSLRSLPADVVKIDRSFISGVLRDGGDEAIVRGVIAMAHATGRTVVAEGVETEQQAARLAQLGCDLAQGYWYSRPVPAIDVDPTRVYPRPVPHARTHTASDR
ncbi:MAG: EAL domain-containing protein [Candidatus Nanopelagicales bacterium]